MLFLVSVFAFAFALLFCLAFISYIFLILIKKRPKEKGFTKCFITIILILLFITGIFWALLKCAESTTTFSEHTIVLQEVASITKTNHIVYDESGEIFQLNGSTPIYSDEIDKPICKYFMAKQSRFNKFLVGGDSSYYRLYIPNGYQVQKITELDKKYAGERFLTEH